MRSQSLLLLVASILVPVLVAAEVESLPAAGAVPDPLSGSNLLQVMVSLLVVLAIITAGAFLLRRYSRLSATANGALRIVAGLSMGPRERIVLLQVGKQQLVVGVAPGSIKTLCVLDEPVGVDSEVDSGAIGFSERLRTAVKAYKNR